MIPFKIMKKRPKQLLYIFLLLDCVVAFILLFMVFKTPYYKKIEKTLPASTKNKKQFYSIMLDGGGLNDKGKSRFSGKMREDTKFILYWSQMWDSKTFGFGAAESKLFQFCRKFKNCYATHDRSLIPIEDFDAIIFHAAQYNEKVHGTPLKRSESQRYIFASMEAPTRAYPTDLRRFQSFYNWTMTYRHDSDITRPYGYVVKYRTNYKMPSIESIKNKTRLIAWFVSNCQTSNKREILYSNLRRHLDIDVYGFCGKLRCQKHLHESSEYCYDLIESKYKFYLSFENAHCKDYVTEKLFRILGRNIVPVVYGEVDYRKIAPPNSVIVADGYKNAEHLAKFLEFLDKHDEEYLKYFEWKKSYFIEQNENKTVCRLCEMLNVVKGERKVYKDIFNWWLGEKHEFCKIGSQLPDIV